MRVNLQYIPSFVRELDTLPAGAAARLLLVVLTAHRSLAAHVLEFASIPSRRRLKVLQCMVLRKDAKLNLVACDVEEGRVGQQDLTENWMDQILNSRPRDVYER